MDYKFPHINTIDDVLPAIAGREEFIVADKGAYTVINYHVVMPDSFPPLKVSGGSAKMRAERQLHNTLRRECRGIKFYPDGRIAARPLHKFFGVGEREETLPSKIDFSTPHSIEHKLDGSMIHPILIEDQVRWCTKMGITDVSLQVEQYVSNHLRYEAFARWCEAKGITPIFEWCSRNQRIVIDYPEDSLILISARHKITGEYYAI